MSDYLDRAIVKLYDKYGKDELVKHFRKQLNTSEIRRGKDESYIGELEYLLEKATEREEVLKSKLAIVVDKSDESLNKVREDELYNELLKSNKKLREQAKKDKATIAELIYKLNNNTDA